VLIEGEEGEPTRMDHLGVEVEDTIQVNAATRRLKDAGLATFEENDTSCCYAPQDKVWVHGPGAEPWEVYVVKGDADTLTKQADSVCCATVAEGTKRWPNGRGGAGILPRRPDGVAGLVDADLVREDHRLDAVAEPQLHQDPLHGGPDRGLLDDERGGDLPVGHSVGDELEGLTFTRGQRVEFGLVGQVGSGLAGHAVDHAAGDRRRHQCVSRSDRVHCRDQLLGAGVFEQEAGGAGAQGAEDARERHHRRSPSVRGDSGSRPVQGARWCWWSCSPGW
jgi:hypothetical protein